MKQFSAILSNQTHPENGAATISFPIPDEQYSQVLEQLEALGAGDAVQRDCRIDELTGGYPVLEQLEATTVNVDELDYLAKRLDGFDSGEAAQFQAMACKLGTQNIQDLINLTFCCQQATVITSFSDLEKVGRDHCMNLNGGFMLASEYEKLDGRSEALKLIRNKEGTVTPYGVVYDNGMTLCEEYDGHSFPDYNYRDSLLAVELTVQEGPEQESRSAWLHLPVPEQQLARAWLRAGADKAYDVEVKVVSSDLPPQMEAALSGSSLEDLNQMCQAIAFLPEEDRSKLAAAVRMTQANTASEIVELAKNLEEYEQGQSFTGF